VWCSEANSVYASMDVAVLWDRDVLCYRNCSTLNLLQFQISELQNWLQHVEIDVTKSGAPTLEVVGGIASPDILPYSLFNHIMSNLYLRKLSAVVVPVVVHEDCESM